MELISRTLPGVNIQSPWSRLILERKKTIETRFYSLPCHYIERKMLIVETPGPRAAFKARIIGIVMFGKSFEYASEEHFYGDSERHLITRVNDPFACGYIRHKRRWGWPILDVQMTELVLPADVKRGIIFTKAIPTE